MSSGPVRAVRLTLRLDADSRQDLAQALMNLAHRVERDDIREGVGLWGSPSEGAVYELLLDPTMTHQRYFAELQQHLAEAQKAG